MATITKRLLLSDLVSTDNIDQVPSNYIRPITQRPNLQNVVHDSIPLINLDQLFGPNRAKIIEQIGLACREYGFFQVKNHSVPESTISNMMQIARDFFNLPEQERLKNYSDDPTKTTRLSTSFNIRTEKLIEAISESLGLDKDYISGQLGNHAQHMALNYYPPCPQPDLTYGLPGHTDLNLITILLQDEVPGLQVLRNGHWVAVDPVPNTFIINIGDQIQVMSNDKYKSVLHRAVVNCDKERISIPTFYCPSPDAIIRPAPELLTDDEPAVYKQFTYGEYYEKFWNRGLATESCLDMFMAT
ncbi:hypothetical protein M8C21_019952 [Ambrosia artemisiifolia]|uniref:Fe2OG dioxygenase domain-containing protein n=1 Tax=Ambrosia artemisiifolia TaxID=4212 RepID=A0AAD5CK15_AMBAR|nr:hypothetical protein M8C21_019952 [Ambrosia artemisiifolia]